MEINRERKLYCPICNCEIPFIPQKISTHLKMCAKKTSLAYADIRVKFLLLNWPEFNTKEKFEEAYNKYSIPDFAKIYGISNPLEFCDIFAIPHRTIQEANKSGGIGQQKIKKVVKERYGVENVLSKESPFYEKRNKTVRERYNVDNVFQRKDIIEKINSDDLYLSKYGVTLSEYRSEYMKKFWANLSDVEKEAWLKKSIWSNSSLINLNKRSFNTSSYEIKILKLLLETPFHVQSQYILKKSNNKRYSYDIFLQELNLLIEINGDYWHANPLKYKSGDIISYPGHSCLVDDIWKRDQEKISFAKENNYNIVVLWTDDIFSIETVNDLFLVISNKMDLA